MFNDTGFISTPLLLLKKRIVAAFKLFASRKRRRRTIANSIAAMAVDFNARKSFATLP
jgi:hypothetical protein